MLLTAFLAACTSAGDDSSGGDAGASHSGDTGPIVPGPATDAVWDGDFVPVYRISFPTEDWAAQLAALIPTDECADRGYLEAAVTYENPESGETETYPRVGVRYRGHSALREGQRFGFKFSFNEYDSAEEFHDLHNVNLMGTEGDFSLMRERLAQDIEREFGVPAPRVNHVQLYVNEVYQGVFPFPEEQDDDPYLDHHFADQTGGLYKVDGYCGGVADFESHGDDPSKYVDRYEPKADTTTAQLQADLFPLFACAAGSDSALASCLPTLVDVPEWLTEIAIDTVLPDVDGLAGVGQNFMMYRDPTTGLLVVYPWDKDQSFSIANAVSRSIWDLHPAWGAPPELTTRLRTVWKDDYCAAVLRVAAVATPTEMASRAEALRTLLAAPMATDPWYAANDHTWKYDVDALVDDFAEHHDEVVAEATACTPP